MREILLVQLKRIGDIVLTAPVVPALKKKYPDARITIAIDAAFASLSEILPADDFLFFKKKSGNRDFWRRLFSRKWDECLEFTGTDRGVLIAALSRAGTRATYSRHQGFWQRIAMNRFVPADVKSLHTVDYHLALAEAGSESLECPFRISQDLSDRMAKRLEDCGVARPFAVVHPGTARAEKMWSARNWERVVRFLRDEAHLAVVFTGGTDPSEMTQIQTICDLAGREGLVSLAGTTSISEMAAVISRAQVFAGVDTGASHIADLLGIPSAVLFARTNPRHWGPRGTKGFAVGAREFTRHPHDFPKSEMSDIPFENFAAALREILPK
ncbi:MAG: glycosyltransferase family 9 protein [Verrucomicrobiota bacterium]